MDTLRRLGFDLSQGYWFGQPKPAAAIDQWLAENLDQPSLQARLRSHPAHLSPQAQG